MMEETSTSDLSSSKDVFFVDSYFISMIYYISGGFYVTATGSYSGKPPFGIEELCDELTFSSSGDERSEEASIIFS